MLAAMLAQTLCGTHLARMTAGGPAENSSAKKDRTSQTGF